jgi:hypothetical protein
MHDADALIVALGLSPHPKDGGQVAMRRAAPTAGEPAWGPGPHR